MALDQTIIGPHKRPPASGRGPLTVSFGGKNGLFSLDEIQIAQELNRFLGDFFIQNRILRFFPEFDRQFHFVSFIDRVVGNPVGIVADLGVKDMANMGAAMAPAAYQTLRAHFETVRPPEDYDLILTGDLGHIGHAVVSDLFERDGVRLGARYDDCGRRIFDRARQDVHAGGSGAGCSAVVLAGDVIKRLRSGEYRRVLLAATGALMSPVSAMQGESIPAVCHAVSIEGEGTE